MFLHIIQRKNSTGLYQAAGQRLGGGMVWAYCAFFTPCNCHRVYVTKYASVDKWLINPFEKDDAKMKWLLIVFVLLGLYGGVSAEPICTHIDMAWLARQAPLPEDARIVHKKDQGNLCEVVLALEGDLVPVYAGKDFLLVGKLFKNRKFITGETLDSLEEVAREERLKADEREALDKEKRKAVLQKNLKVLADLTLFSFKPGKADRFLYVITDPNCSYCKKLLPELEILAMENHIEIRVILFPVLGSESREMAAQAICEKLSYEAYGKMKFVPGAKCSQADLLLEKTMPFFSDAGFSFVPVVISGDGTWVVEGNDLAQVKQHLGISCDQVDGVSPAGCTKD